VLEGELVVAVPRGVEHDPLLPAVDLVEPAERQLRPLLKRPAADRVEELQVGRLGRLLGDLVHVHRDAELAVRPVVRLEPAERVVLRAGGGGEREDERGRESEGGGQGELGSHG
jgi:hypothetical protein